MKILLVPMHVDALLIREDANVAGPTADFARLPYFDGSDRNVHVPYLGEAILQQPFTEPHFVLRAGVHLHWALPDALTRGRHDDAGTDFPIVPDRWLVIERRQGTVQRRWVVESDYIHEPGIGRDSITIPVPEQDRQNAPEPYRRLGRQLPYAEWRAAQGPADEPDGSGYLRRLSAVGYGEESFAAYYPNCHSVFGFHDPGIPGDDETVFDVVGFYSRANAGKDYLVTFLSEALSGEDGADIATLLREELDWDVQAGITAGEEPQRLLCCGRVHLKDGHAPDDGASAAEDAPVHVGLGSTGPDAYAAYLADRVRAESRHLHAEQLIALLEGNTGRSLDVGPKFDEARHGREFFGAGVELIWALRPRSASTASSTIAADAPAAPPEELADLLNELNVLQIEYHRCRDELHSLRQRLFADWHRYLLSAAPPEVLNPGDPLGDPNTVYPDEAETTAFLQRRGVEPIARLSESTGRLFLNETEGTLSVGELDDDGALSRRVLRRFERMQAALQEFHADAAVPWELYATPSERYYAPNDPVVVLPEATPTDRHQNGRLSCEVADLGDEFFPLDDPAVLSGEALSAIEDRLSDFLAAAEDVGRRDGYSDWHPIFLEWEAELEAQDLDGGDYTPDFITKYFRIPAEGPELELQAEAPELQLRRSRYLYRGRAVLSPLPLEPMRDAIVGFLDRAILREFATERGLTVDGDVRTFLREQYDAVLRYYYETATADVDPQTSNEQQLAGDPVHTALLAFPVAEEAPGLAQALGGFHEALLMQTSDVQMEIDDPDAFPKQRAFVESVRDALGDDAERVEILSRAPQPWRDFRPLRSGFLRVLRLRLIDSFGRLRELRRGRTLRVTAMDHDLDDALPLPPRIVQPARLRFRFYSARADREEANDHPAASPICGWVQPDFLDSSLQFYDADGTSLGSLLPFPDPEEPERGCWQPAMTVKRGVDALTNANPHLRRLVLDIQARGAGHVAALVQGLEERLELIEPEEAREHPHLLLLTSTPLALVRAKLDLEVQGLPALDQSWEAFFRDLGRTRRETADFEYVQFPIRLGAREQLGDGLARLWLEGEDGALHDAADFAEPFTINTSIADPAVNVSMLVDPRAAIHAVSGILPVKAIRVQAAHYAAALQRIHAHFPIAPVLIDPDDPRLPLPEEAGFRWSWIEQRRIFDEIAFEHVDTASTPALGRSNDRAALPGRLEIREGRLHLLRKDQDG